MAGEAFNVVSPYVRREAERLGIPLVAGRAPGVSPHGVTAPKPCLNGRFPSVACQKAPHLIQNVDQRKIKLQGEYRERLTMDLNPQTKKWKQRGLLGRKRAKQVPETKEAREARVAALTGWRRYFYLHALSRK
jgi:hypothetical protein